MASRVTFARLRLRSFAVLGLFALPPIALACGGKTSADPDSGTTPDSQADAQVDGPIEDVISPPPDGTPPPDTDPPPVSPTDKVDLLLVIDNSLSMSDKQAELARRVPELVAALTNPPAGPGRKAIADLHIGVITSSLGSHGTSACDPGSTSAHNNDHAHLLPRAGEGGGAGCPTPVAASALTWTFGASSSARFSGVAGVHDLQVATTCVVQSAREDGCGYEETLESMYHFLIDPKPYAKAEVKCTFGVSGDNCTTGGSPNRIEVTGVDDELLKERASFLRPDSVVQIVILSDENDFSLKPAQLNWLPWGYGAGQMQRGFAACKNVPDDFEPETAAEYMDLHSRYDCKSCFEDTSDPNCAVPWAKDKLNADPDDRNLRGFHMTQRFGYNFLWSRERYVQGLTSKAVPSVDASGAVVSMPNPLFSGGRAVGNVFFATIVGVTPSLVQDASGAPRTLGAAEWNKIISPDLTVRDPHMIESIAPRPGVKKFAGDRTIDPANGGDRDVSNGDDLQFACIGPRAVTTASFDCEGSNPELTNPLCDPGHFQPYFKAYPGLRHLRVAHDLGARAVVGSVCSASLSPVMAAIADKLQAALKGR